MDSTQCEVRGGVWVCKECGFAYSMTWRDVIRRLSTASDRWRQAVGRLEPASTDLGVRPGLWSPRQYVAHIADWAEIIAGRIVLILREDAPFIEDIDQDHRAAELGYDQWDTTISCNRYADAVARIVDALESGGSAGWQRMGVREVLGPQPLSLYAQDVVHELEHHLMDIGGNDPPGPSA